jgi:glycosyltransferase involved in cell wall biosynthesis
VHIGIIGPVNIPAFADRLCESDGRIARQQPTQMGTAPTALALALLDAGHTVTAVTHWVGPALDLQGERLRLIRAESRPRPRQRALTLWRRERSDMVQALLESNPDVVHAHWTYEWALTALATRLPVAITVRDAPLTVVRYRPDLYRLIRMLMSYEVRVRSSRAAVAAVSPYLAKKWRWQTLSAAQIDIIPNIAHMINVGDVRKTDHPTLVEVADDGKRKNIPTLLRAFAIVHARNPHAELRLVGGGLGPDGRISKWAHLRGLGDGVRFWEYARGGNVHRHGRYRRAKQCRGSLGRRHCGTTCGRKFACEAR